MVFPDSIRILLKLKNTSVPVAGCAILITVFAHRKNNYMLTLFTDDDGRVELKKEAVEKEIYQSMAHFLMDYASSLSECNPVIRLDVVSIDEIRSQLEGMEIWAEYFSETRELMSKLRIAENGKYKPCTVMLNVEEETEIEIEVEMQ